MANDSALTQASDSTDPAASGGIWYLARGVNCNVSGSYDSQGPSQIGSRDAEIAVSANTCP